MNYLAHLLLSGSDKQMMVGGLLGDFVKGALKGERPARIEQGILLHRRIDALCGQMEEMHLTMRRFDPPFRRYAGIVVDICYDHFLASDWRRYHDTPLEIYCRDFYASLASYSHILPPRAQHFCRLAPRLNWLEGYAERANLPAILNRVGQRLQRTAALEDALETVDRDYGQLRREFHSFFPKLIEFSLQQRRQMSKL